MEINREKRGKRKVIRVCVRVCLSSVEKKSEGKKERKGVPIKFPEYEVSRTIVLYLITRLGLLNCYLSRNVINAVNIVFCRVLAVET